MFKKLRVVASGLVAGFLIGSLGLVFFIANTVSDLSQVWTTLIDQNAFPYWAVFATAAGVNGAIGAWSGWKSISRATPVAGIPLFFLLLPISSCITNPGHTKMWVPELLVVVFVGVFVWVSGRVGQELGARQRPNREPSALSSAT